MSTPTMTLFKLHAISPCQDESLPSRSRPIHLRSARAIVLAYGKKAPICDKNATIAYRPSQLKRPLPTI
jgi:hypothetical protein